MLSAGHPEKQGLKHKQNSARSSAGFSLSGSSRKTRIETEARRSRGTGWRLSAGHPEKQGLKPHRGIRPDDDTAPLSGSSRKTRIETKESSFRDSVVSHALSGSSRKTRIETSSKYRSARAPSTLSAGHPEKQGLKLAGAAPVSRYCLALSGSSRKTRIETPHHRAALRRAWQLSAGHPEKQGLKPNVLLILSPLELYSQRVIQKNKD